MENPFELLFNKITAIEDAIGQLLNEKYDKQNQNESYSGFLNITQAAKYLHVARQTLYGLTSSRRIQHYKTGKFIFFKKQELDIWIEKHKIKTREEIKNEASAWITRRYHSNKK